MFLCVDVIWSVVNFFKLLCNYLSKYFWFLLIGCIYSEQNEYLFIWLFKMNLNFVQSVSWKWKSACINYWCLYRLLPQRALFYSPSHIVYFYVKMNSSKPFYAQGSEDAKIIYRDPETISSFSLIPVTVQ